MSNTSDNLPQPAIAWREQIASLLGQYPTAVALSDIEIRIPRPADLPADVELANLLQVDPQQRFAVSGSGPTSRARRVFRADDEELKEYVVEWRNNLERYLSTQSVPISLSDLGSHIVRPSKLPAAVKLIDVLKLDPHKRFVITSEASGGKAHLYFELNEEQINSLIEQWRENVSRFICNSSTSTSMTDINANVLRPHFLDASITLYDILKSDPQNRFALSGDPSSFRVRRVFRVDDESILPYVEAWRNAVAQFLSVQFSTVSLSDIGSHISRPPLLPISVKLIDVLKSDPWHRFVLSGDGNNIRAALSTSARGPVVHGYGEELLLPDASAHRVMRKPFPNEYLGVTNHMSRIQNGYHDDLRANMSSSPYGRGFVSVPSVGANPAYQRGVPKIPFAMNGASSFHPQAHAQMSSRLMTDTYVDGQYIDVLADVGQTMVPTTQNHFSRDSTGRSMHTNFGPNSRGMTPGLSPTSLSGQAVTSKFDPTTHPKKFMCPISGMMMMDPVICSDGYTYERSSIEDWMLYSRLSPVTNQELVNTLLSPDISMKQAIETYLLSSASAQKMPIRQMTQSIDTPTGVADLSAFSSRRSSFRFWESGNSSEVASVDGQAASDVDSCAQSLHEVAAQLCNLSMSPSVSVGPLSMDITSFDEFRAKELDPPAPLSADWRAPAPASRLSGLLSVATTGTAASTNVPPKTSPIMLTSGIHGPPPGFSHSLGRDPPTLSGSPLGGTGVPIVPTSLSGLPNNWLLQTNTPAATGVLEPSSSELSIDLASWLSQVFVGFDRDLIRHFSSKLQNDAGFLTVADLLDARHRSQLTFDLLQNTAGFKIGHYNRLIGALSRLDTN